MRLEIVCKDRLGLVRELLDLLVTRKIDLYGIEILALERLYLRFSPIPFDEFSSLMAEIRRTPGVTDVRTVTDMPSERENRVLNSLLVAMPEPVLSVDLKGRIELANPAALSLFGQDEKKIRHHNISQLIEDFRFPQVSEGDVVTSLAQCVVIHGRDFLMELIPIYLPDNQEQQVSPVGAMIMLKSTARMGHQLQNLNSSDDSGFAHIVAVSPGMRQLVNQAKKLAMHDAPLLIIGETGTGKDVLARACHMRSKRSAKPFLALNCASLPDDVAESELFGHAAGAYPNALENKKGFFEQASGGSVLLDEIGEMSPRMQTKLLRFLNDGTFRRVGEEHEVHVDVRVICATQKNLQELVTRGEFREDLFYRLNVLTLNLPALREHPQDILPLTEMFVARFSDEQGIRCPAISPQLPAFLGRYSWPGNVRQLKNILYRAMTQLEGEELQPKDIVLPEQYIADLTRDDNLEGSLDDITSRYERAVLTRLYDHYPSTRKLAKRLGVSHTAIANKLREYGLNNKKGATAEEESS
ncbi:transcriptional regulator [Tatumella morbirosei]|uniref:HTH-type transcriptional regulatory protein TyrR n=1 Tax=Tatumella morbirosei TaxID=642227 RepID=A0A095UF99_9GAMM|nr:transcriptional regulator TyrR [Tatumella morbirosei]KGD73088.1 transcriptional regulator [Tatumella morbirosei]